MQIYDVQVYGVAKVWGPELPSLGYQCTPGVVGEGWRLGTLGQNWEINFALEALT